MTQEQRESHRASEEEMNAGMSFHLVADVLRIPTASAEASPAPATALSRGPPSGPRTMRRRTARALSRIQSIAPAHMGTAISERLR
jgi:hypothetical protein